MARKVIYKQNGFLNSPDSPTGYTYLGYDGTSLSEKTGSVITAIVGGGGDFLPLAGGTMSGNIALSGMSSTSGGAQLLLSPGNVVNLSANGAIGNYANQGYMILTSTQTILSYGGSDYMTINATDGIQLITGSDNRPVNVYRNNLRITETNATYYTDIKLPVLSANRTITFPDESGTVALVSSIKTHKMTMTTGAGTGVSTTAHGLGSINVLSVSSIIDDGTYQIPNMFTGDFPQNSFYSVIAKGTNIELRTNASETNILSSTVTILITYETI